MIDWKQAVSVVENGFENTDQTVKQLRGTADAANQLALVLNCKAKYMENVRNGHSMSAAAFEQAYLDQLKKLKEKIRCLALAGWILARDMQGAVDVDRESEWMEESHLREHLKAVSP